MDRVWCCALWGGGGGGIPMGGRLTCGLGEQPGRGEGGARLMGVVMADFPVQLVNGVLVLPSPVASGEEATW